MKSSLDTSLLVSLLKEHKTPFYFYSRKTLENTINEIKKAFAIEDFQLLFATMANDNPEFLETIAANNVGACINSIRHFKLATACGIAPEKIQFTSTGLGTEDMAVLQKAGVAVNFDSLNQLRQWFQLKRGGKAGVRINTASLTDKVQVVDRLGIEKEQVSEALEMANDNSGVINGLHIYVGTNYRTHIEMLPALKGFFSLAASVPSLEYVNIGGGIGIDYLSEGYEFDIQEYGKSIIYLTNELRKKTRKSVKLIFEPGRGLAAPSGWFVTKITDIKKLNNTRYIVVDASVAVFPRPLHHPDTPHKAITPFKNGELGFEDTVVVGKTTFSRDILSRSVLSKSLDIGDVIVFDQAGAYCDSMRSKFLGQGEPKNIFIE